MASEVAPETPVLHVVVVGFHHKKGCQVEYSYPPVIPGNPVDSHDLPEEWKHLPSLALPDGAHNFVKDTVFFHLPGRQASKKTVYCVSCYRQMDAKDLLNRTADITRSTVQKSVCVISRLPLYGLIKAKLELITHAYFDERDFSKVELLEQTFNNLNASLTESQLTGTQIFLGLSTRDAVSHFKHKLLMLFKLILLERRVLFFGSPVEVLGSSILSVLSLFPGMLECGLEQAVNGEGQRQVSPTMGVASLDPGEGGTGEEFLEVRYHQTPQKEGGEANLALSELMPHVHNAPVDDMPATDASNQAPESPTILRGDVMTELASAATRMTHKDMENKHKDTETRQRRNSAGLEVHKSTKNQLASHHPSSVSSQDVTTGQRPHSLSSQSSEPAELQTTDLAGIVISPNGPSPAVNVTSNTQVSAIQTGRTLPNDQDALDGYAREVEAASSGYDTVSEGLTELTLVTDNSDPLLGRSDSVEELDSPESISRIDREDCFSWDDDRGKLALSMDGEDAMTAEHTTPDSHDAKDPSSVGSEDRDSTDHPSENSTHSTESSRASTPQGAPSAKVSPLSQNKNKTKAGAFRKQGSPARKTAALKNKLSTAFSKVGKSKGKDLDVEMRPIIKGEVRLQQDQFGFPLAVFTKGCVCHPYLSLQFHSILNDVNIRGFVMGATNILFRQQKQVTDVIVEVDDVKLEVKDRELQRQLQLTTADLRFSEYLVRVVTEDRSSVYLDGTEWEGSDEWIRAQFRNYLQCLLSTMMQEDGKLLEDFGLPFVTAWRTTHNFRHWLDTAPHPKMADLPSGHPFQGNLSVNDVKMKFNHTMQSTERGRKINAAVVQTGKYVMQTGKAVGGALSSARSAVSSWFTSIANDWRHSDEEEEGGAGGDKGGESKDSGDKGNNNSE